MRRPGSAKLWIKVGCAVLGAAALWVIAITVLPEGGWLRPAQITGFGLVVIFGLIVLFLILDDRDWKKMDSDRKDRRRKRKATRD